MWDGEEGVERSDFICDLFEMVLGSKAEGNKTMRKKPTVSSKFQVSFVGGGRGGKSDFVYDLFAMVLGSKAEGNKTMRKKPTVSSQFQVSFVEGGGGGKKI